ncbi:prophage tail fiber N-terminal domain-containing protein [Serratia sp. BW106]|uniref:prophage tail fiber N-terminal domain-containing protein n=1 Tax=Serratia sp. BW106 TaxID=1884636 RepID=UPI000BFF963F|nr:prophage tail fiber N-terminal domain-containing protein [Serratia sp. BW106]
MSILVEGTLLSPAGNVIGAADIVLTSISTNLVVLGGTPLSVQTDPIGRYSFTLNNGNYAVSVSKEGNNWFSGTITVTDLTVPKSINSLILQDAMMAEIPVDYWSYFQAQTGILFTNFGKIDDAVTSTSEDKETVLNAKLETIAAKDVAVTAAGNAQNIADANTYYITLEDPDGTIAGLAGTDNGQMFRVAIPDGDGVTVAFNWYRNNANAAEFVNSEPSRRYIESINKLINKNPSDSAINMNDSVGRKALITNEDGSIDVHTLSTEYSLIKGGDDGWLHKTIDKAGNVLYGMDAQGRTHGFFVNHADKKDEVSDDPYRIRLEDVARGVVVNPNQFEGVTQHDRINAALAFLKQRGEGTLVLGLDTVSEPQTRKWIINEALLLHSNLTLYLDKSTLKLTNRKFDNIIRNDGIVPDPPNIYSYARELNENVNIRILGSSKTESFIEGPDVPYSAPHPINGGAVIPWTGDWYGWRTIGILLANCKNYELAGFTMRKTTCWAISQERGCDGMYLHDINFDTTVKNGDGIDFRMGCSNGVVERISGNTADDTIALSALLNFQQKYPAGSYIWPLQVSGDAPHPLGDNIKNITIRDVKSKSLHNQVRILLTNGAKIDGITVSDVEDTGPAGATQVIVQTGAYGSPSALGDLTNIIVNGITSNYSQVPLNIDVPIKDSMFNFVRQRKEGGDIYKINTSLPIVNTTVTNAKAE